MALGFRLVNKNRFASRQEMLRNVNSGRLSPISEVTLHSQLHGTLVTLLVTGSQMVDWSNGKSLYMM